jgi:aryl-alcohol dehydrogenase-like predicted oxidoreductase
MKTRKLGHSGPNISAIGFGAMSITGFFGPTDDATSLRCMSAAYDHGIDFFDTADIYGSGTSETLIGQFLEQTNAKIKIATKSGIQTEPVRQFNNSKEYLSGSLDASLKRMGVDYVDLFYIHRREAERPIEEVVHTLKGFIDAGKIGGYGLSEVSPTTLRRAHNVHPCTAVQNEYSLWTRLPDLGLIRTCAELGVAFVPFSPLGRGMLTDAPAKRENMVSPDLRINNPRFMEPNLSDNLAMVKTFQAWAADNGMTTATAALAWVLSRGEHLIPIPATRTAEHLSEWVGASEVSMSQDQLREIEEILPSGWAYGDRYSISQYVGPETYC